MYATGEGEAPKSGKGQNSERNDQPSGRGIKKSSNAMPKQLKGWRRKKTTGPGRRRKLEPIRKFDENVFTRETYDRVFSRQSEDDTQEKCRGHHDH